MNPIALSPKNQNELYFHKGLFLEFVDLYNKNNLPNKIIFSGQKGLGKATLAYHITNYIFSKNEELNYNINSFNINSSNKSYKLICNNSHPNFHLINLSEDKKAIEISQIRKMISYTNKTSFNNKEKIILIDNVEFLNLNSLNALLKIAEEPNENIFFFMIFDSSKKLLNTLKSRCIKYNFNISFKESINLTNKIIKDDIYNFINPKLISYYSTPGELINLLNFSLNSKMDLLNTDLKNFLINIIENKLYKKNHFIKNNIYKYIEFYFLNLTKLNFSKVQISKLYNNFIHKISDLKKFNLDEEAFFIEFKSEILNEQ